MNGHGVEVPLSPAAVIACMALACGSTTLSLAISAVAGWTRGESGLNSAFWAGFGILTTAAAHLLLPVTKNTRSATRVLLWMAWAGCMSFVVGSHASYFLASQQDRGEQHVTKLSAPTPVLRPLSSVMKERANLEFDMRSVSSTACAPDCSAMRRKVTAMKAQLAALDQEAQEIQLAGIAQAGVERRQDRARHDAFVWALSAWLSVPALNIELIRGLLVGLLVDGLGCVMWSVLLSRSAHQTALSLPEITQPVPENCEATAEPIESRVIKVVKPKRGMCELELTSQQHYVDSRFSTSLEKARDALATGKVRNTVRGLRSYLECSQVHAHQVYRALQDTDVPHDLSATGNTMR